MVASNRRDSRDLVRRHMVTCLVSGELGLDCLTTDCDLMSAGKVLAVILTGPEVQIHSNEAFYSELCPALLRRSVVPHTYLSRSETTW